MNCLQNKKATTVAPNLDLKEVAPLPEPVVEPEHIEPTEIDDQTDVLPSVEDTNPEIKTPSEQLTETEPVTRKKLIILGAEVPKAHRHV